ncbi:hypothetical protein F5Y06DRAFT_306535 [Hypoxylon sp. FL0890]|nr:hypothetical protein F5Y06DRAFT_306535 [Hypoxylon sp. FL0890]
MSFSRLDEMDSSSFLEVPRPPYYCEPCYLILFGEKPPVRPSPFDQTPCSHCGEPVGGKYAEEDKVGDVSDDWVTVDAAKDTFSLDTGKDDWESIHDSDLDSDKEPETEAKPKPMSNGESNEQREEPPSSPVSSMALDVSDDEVMPLVMPRLPHEVLVAPSDEVSTPGTRPSTPKTPSIVVSDHGEEDADAGEPKSETENANARADPVTPGLRLLGVSPPFRFP